ncbi:MAG: hypothetical protein CSA65_03405 [Proteobacteria bacterium]|nr:MAG: hypothetical protein CSA65_03405 [Pseudomonadota bacterium]
MDGITFFVRALHRQKEALEGTIEQERLMAPLAPLSDEPLATVAEHGRVTVRDAESLTKAKRDTIKDHLNKRADARVRKTHQVDAPSAL